MKIAMIDPSLFTWPYDSRLARGFEQNGHKVAILGRDPGRRLEADESRYLRKHFYPGVETKFMRRLPQPIFLALKGLSHIESMVRLVWKLRQWKPDAIHFQWTPLAMVDKYFIDTFRRMAPTVLTVHDSAPFNDSPRPALQKLAATSIMRRFDALIVHTASARMRLIENGVEEWKINRVPHGLMMEDDVRPEERVVTAPTDGRVTLLLFGQIKPYKGVDVLLRALALLPETTRQKCRVRIVGRPQMPMEPIYALADELGVRPLVEFDTRFIPDDEIRDMMIKADIQLFPYRQIDASGVLMIAIPAGKPIVASDIGLFRELLQDGLHGALVKPGDPADLARALTPLIEDDNRRAQAAQAVRQLANGVPDWRVIAQMTEDVYRRAKSL